MGKPQLFGTPLSHFTRKIRVLLLELDVAFDFVRTTSVLATTAAAYGDNPLMRVPTLLLGAETVIDSDHIARYLIARYDPSDRLGVTSDLAGDLNRLAVVSGIMDNEVSLILAKRAGLVDVDGVAYFRKLQAAIEAGLAWLDRHTAPEEGDFDYRDVATICMWQHLAHYGMVRSLESYERIGARVARFAGRPSVAGTTPAISLAEATAAGWKPT
jgi:glutathione S-transferase